MILLFFLKLSFIVLSEKTVHVYIEHFYVIL